MDRMPLESQAVRFGWDGRLLSHPGGRFWLWKTLRAAEVADAAGAGAHGESARRGAFIRVYAAWRLWWPRRESGAQLQLRVELISRQPVRIPYQRPDEPVSAVARLVRAWPEHLRVVTRRWDELWIWLLPHSAWLGSGLRAGDIDVAEAVAWTAVLDILGGQDPAHAIRQAHRCPLFGLLGGPSDQNAWSSVCGWFRTGRPALVDPELEWLFAGTGQPLADRAASDAPEAWVDGFRLGRFARGTPPEIKRIRGVLAETGGRRQRGWVVTGVLKSALSRSTLHDGLAFRVKVDRLPEERYGDLKAWEYHRAITAVLRAWPAGEKALLLPDSAFSRGAARMHEFMPIGWVAVRKPGLGSAATADLFRAACRLASNGMTRRQLRSWLESLSPREAEAVVGLHALAG